MFSNRLIFEPCARVRNTFYRCDSKFYLDEILSMYEDHDTNAVIYTDGNYCTWYLLKNRDLKKVATITIHLQNQFKEGGQSQNRLLRLRMIQRNNNLTRLAEKTIELLYDKTANCQKSVNIIFCGPAEFKIELSEHKLISQFFTNIHILTMSDMNYELLIDYTNKIVDPAEYEITKYLQYMINTADSKLVFGQDIKQSLEDCEIKTLYVHKDNEFLKDYIPLYKLEIIKVSASMINEFGGMIGIKFYYSE